MSEPEGSIVFVLPWSSDITTGGVNNVVSSLYNCFKKQKQLKPIIMEADWEFKKIQPHINENGHNVIKIRLILPPNSIKSIMSFFALLPVMLLRYLQLIKDNNVQVINFHYPSHSVFIIALIKAIGLFKGKIVLSFHGTDVHNLKIMSRYHQVLWKFILKNTAQIITCSHDLANILKQETPCFQGANICVAHNGISPIEFFEKQEFDQKIENTLSQQQYILSVGKFIDDKGHAILINAFASLTDSYPELFLKIIGADGVDLNHFKDLAKKLEILDKIEFVLNLPNNRIGIYYQHAELFVLASRKEAFGLAILEAGLYKIPVIASRTGGIPEILSDGKNGQLFEVDDVSSLTDILRNTIENPKRSRECAEVLYSDIHSKFLWKNTYKKYISKII